jgi:hypothetical protein
MNKELPAPEAEAKPHLAGEAALNSCAKDVAKLRYSSDPRAQDPEEPGRRFKTQSLERGIVRSLFRLTKTMKPCPASID